MACHTRCAIFWLTAGEALMVRETVAIETLASAATVRISGLLGTVVRLPFRLTQPCYFVFVQVQKNPNPFGILGVSEGIGIRSKDGAGGRLHHGFGLRLGLREGKSSISAST